MIYHGVDARSKVRDSERLISYNNNIASARPDVCEARGKCEGNGAQNTNSDRTIAHPKSKFSNGQTMKVYCDRNSQYGGNRSRRLDSRHDDEIEMTKNAKRIIITSQAGRDERCSQAQMMLLRSISEQVQSNPNRGFWKT